MKNLLAALLAILITSCNSPTPPDTNHDLPDDPAVLAQIQAGKSLLEANCQSCHSPEAQLTGRLAPSMLMVKNHYLNDSTTLSGFTADIVRFVGRPSKGYSKMPGAVGRFGLMPQLQYPEEDLKAIAAFVYHADLEDPEWLEKQRLGERRSDQDSPDAAESFADRGRRFAMQTKSVLGSNLLKAIQAGGPEHAVSFCNVRAETLTDSSGTAQNISIRRVSDRPRNPDNAADSLQLFQIAALREDLARGKTQPYRLYEEKEIITGYYPIITNDMCLKCHGDTTDDLSPATLSALRELYPADQATGYAANQLRGIWVVEMPRKK
ncbi:DUF3365 domain-containing protein [Neolewinella aurantiaca]|uniref:DUF3365 domain-containing protein n=1 Tax=Neolewinella aurantiaca TaxID=2602767 RepID=A0A5C7FBF0_9BACT|nr:DUF3365 domain-containing protein [Neolewinella aurantiaca]TXF88040.1 DUF3365 domain-containing protein [Neolewinella aurantiaca]